MSSIIDRKISDDMFRPAHIKEDEKEKLSHVNNGFWYDSFRRFTKNKGAVTGLALIVLIIILAFMGPSLNEFSYDKQDLSRAYLPPKIPILENIPLLGLDGIDSSGVDQYKQKNIDEYHWFGTDQYGRDQWTRVWKGTQISLYIAFLAAAIDLVIGVTYGGISGFYGGKVDNILQRFIEIMIGIPNLIIIVLLLLVLDPGIISITIALVLTGWVGMARIVRSQMLKLKNEEFVLASRTLGASNRRLITKHLIPNSLGQIIVTTMFTIPSAIFFEAFLSFIGLGLRPPEASLGSLVNDGFKSLLVYPYLVFWPSLIISILMISFNLLGDGLRDVFDPKLRK